MDATGAEPLTYGVGAFGASGSVVAKVNPEAVAGASGSADLVAQLAVAPDGDEAAALVPAAASVTGAAFATPLDVHGPFAGAPRRFSHEPPAGATSGWQA